MKKTANILEKIPSVIQSRAPLTESEFNALALELFEWQRERNAPYREFCRGKKIRHWREIPAAPTTAFKEAALTTIPPRARVREFRSSGTTRHIPSRHFHSAQTLKIYEASVRAGFRRFVCAGRADGVVCFRDFMFLTPSPREAPHSSLVWMMETLRRQFGGEFFVKNNRVGAAALIRILSRCVEEERGCALLGTALAFAEFFDHLAARRARLRLPRGSWALETGGFKGRGREISREEFYAQFEQRLGLRRTQILGEYGMCELSSQFYAREDGIFRGPPWARVVVMDPETGGEARKGGHGLIRIFDLANVGGALAVQTEDVGVRPARKGRGGEGFELIGRAPMAEARGCSWMLR